MQPVVAYYRVSTERQGRSGLGLDAQRERCAVFAAGNGMEVADTFTEVETGKGSDAAVLHGPGMRAQLPQPLLWFRQYGRRSGVPTLACG